MIAQWTADVIGKMHLLKITKECFLCHRQCECARHHLMPGKNRAKSDRLGLYVPLCPDCHRAVHTSDRESMLYLQRYAEQTMLKRGWTVEKWIQEFGKNYL